jgi:hypothetical protein
MTTSHKLIGSENEKKTGGKKENETHPSVFFSREEKENKKK